MEALLGCFAIFGFFIALPFLVIYDVWAWAHVMITVWAWFAVPAWGQQPISFQQAVALGVVFAVLRVRGSSSSSVKKGEDGKTDWGHFIGQMISAVLAPWITLFCCWFIKIIFM